MDLIGLKQLRCALTVLVLLAMPNALAQLPGTADAGIYQIRCAICHEMGVERAPHTSTLQVMSPNSVYQAMNGGIMSELSVGLSETDRLDIIEHLFGSRELPPKPALPRCESINPLSFDRPPNQAGWGFSHGNTRFVPQSSGGITADNVADLQIKWVFAIPQQDRSRSQPLVAGGTVVFGSGDGTVYSLDEETGCVRWTYDAGIEVRTGITISSQWPSDHSNESVSIVFGDYAGKVHSLNLDTGEPLWVSHAHDHQGAMITAQPQYFDGVVYASVSSREYAYASDQSYSCCSFRGAVTAFDAQTGDLVWRTFVIPEPATAVGLTRVGVPIFAPSGAPIWNSVNIDPKRNQLYFGTGESYSSPADDNSDAIFALDLNTGEINWKWQSLAKDAWNLSCNDRSNPDHPNCPSEDGPDYDFGASTILVQGAERDILIAGQKSGEVFGLDPDTGDVLWRNRVGAGGGKGGVHFGMAVEGDTLYIPINDSLRTPGGRPGIFALDAFSGSTLWEQESVDNCAGRSGCGPGASQAITAIPGAVLVGYVDGMFRAFTKDSGSLLFEYDTVREFQGVGDISGRGGSFGGGAGPVIYDGVMYLSSGYTMGYMPGNVVIALEVPR